MRNPATSCLALILLAGMALFGAQSIEAQTYQVIYNFHGEFDGDGPRNGLTVDRGGNLYGVTADGGLPDCALLSSCGTVFELTRRNSAWVFGTIYSFDGQNGACPAGEVAIGADGTIYGTTEFGGPGGEANCAGGQGYGVVYSLRHPATLTSGWRETVLYPFTGGTDGAHPTGPVVFDAEGNLYLTAGGGISYDGIVAEFTPGQGSWTEDVLYSFTGGNDGAGPTGGVTFDHDGNVYGTTLSSPGDQLFQLMLSRGIWTKNTLHQFEGGTDGKYPYGELIFGQSGNLYGTTSAGGAYGSGTVFMLSPSGGSWDYAVIYSFQGPSNCGPQAGVIIDAAGNLYGTTVCDGVYQQGSVFKLAPSSAGSTYTSLHDFTGASDGGGPYDRLAFDANGNLYGTASYGGTGCFYGGCGVVFEIAP